MNANPVAQTATVTFDPECTSVAELREWVRYRGRRSPLEIEALTNSGSSIVVAVNAVLLKRPALAASAQGNTAETTSTAVPR